MSLPPPRRWLLWALVCAAALAPAVATAGCGEDEYGEPSDGGAAEEEPAPFWGVVPQDKTTRAQFERLARGGVDSVRLGFDWAKLMPRLEGPVRWELVDQGVRETALAGLKALPFVYGTPRWLASDEGTLPVQNAGQQQAWTRFLRALVGRYGRAGHFWSANPDVPRQPIETWQIWNEPNFFYFASRPDPEEYGLLVKVSHAAINPIDPKAKLILGGMFALPRERPPLAYPAHRFLTLMYKAHPDIGRNFNAVAIHPYTRDHRFLERILDQVRWAVRRAGDPGADMWITEMGWGSQSGPQATGFEKGLQGQARQLRAAFQVLLANRARWRLRRVYWFTVADYAGGDACNFCDSAGLFDSRFQPKPAWRAYMRFADRPLR